MPSRSRDATWLAGPAQTPFLDSAVSRSTFASHRIFALFGTIEPENPMMKRCVALARKAGWCHAPRELSSAEPEPGVFSRPGGVKWSWISAHGDRNASVCDSVARGLSESGWGVREAFTDERSWSRPGEPPETQRPSGHAGAGRVGRELNLIRHDKDFALPEGLNWGYARKGRGVGSPGLRDSLAGVEHVEVRLSAPRFERELGRRAFNLSMSLERHGRQLFPAQAAPRPGSSFAILVDCHTSPDTSVNRENRYRHLRSWPELLDLRGALDLAWTSRDPDFFTSVLLSDFLHSYKSRFEIRQNIGLSAITGVEDRNAEASRRRAPQLEGESGYAGDASEPGIPIEHRGEAVRSRPIEPPADQSTARLNRQPFTRRFLDLAAAHGIRVFYLLPPVAPGHMERRIHTGEDLELTRLAQRIQRDDPSVVVIEGRRAGIPGRSVLGQLTPKRRRRQRLQQRPRRDCPKTPRRG